MELSKKEREIISLALIVYDNAVSKQGNFEELPTKEEILNLYYKILESK